MPRASRRMPYAVCVFPPFTSYQPLATAAPPLLPNRHADPMDVLWMTLGSFVGALVAWLVARCVSVC